MTKLLTLAAKYKIDILGSVPEHAGAPASKETSDHKVG